ncbi:DUF29 domain-containing protein [Endozoicomonas sp. 4G]|uniref:DUF29 domain-containing protein n=1 Tax=Endozoicomonas sp. 4G TaxID=2872754 RepID=UPI002078B2D3|nr:DUF29 domain-containing protein [Endozoicomonas sp. 4G]
MENLYKTDYYQWVKQQKELLINRQFDQLDLENLIEEVDDMGKHEPRSLTSHLKQLLMHLLKWHYQPEHQSRSWQDSIILHREDVEELLLENPSLNPKLPELYSKAYKRAVALAVKQTGLPAKTFPKECPWAYKQVMRDGWLPGAE